MRRCYPREKSLVNDIEKQTQSWSKALHGRLTIARLDDPALLGFLKLLDDIEALEAIRRQILAYAITIPAGAETNSGFAVALERLLVGKSPFALPFWKAEKYDASAITIAGLRPSIGGGLEESLNPYSLSA